MAKIYHAGKLRIRAKNGKICPHFLIRKTLIKDDIVPNSYKSNFYKKFFFVCSIFWSLTR